MKKITLIILIAMVSLVTGCASITGSKNQPISVSAVCGGEPVDGANCTLMNDKGTWYGLEVERVGPVEQASVYQTAKAFALSVKQGEVNVKHDQEDGAKSSDSNIPF